MIMKRCSPRFRARSRNCWLGADELGVDLAVDAVRWQPAATSVVGPTLAPIELAGQKVAALFNRAALRDFAEVWTLSKRFG